MHRGLTWKQQTRVGSVRQTTLIGGKTKLFQETTACSWFTLSSEHLYYSRLLMKLSMSNIDATIGWAFKNKMLPTLPVLQQFTFFKKTVLPSIQPSGPIHTSRTQCCKALSCVVTCHGRDTTSVAIFNDMLSVVAASHARTAQV